MTTHSSILAWEIPWTEEPGGLYNPWGHYRVPDTTQQLNKKKNALYNAQQGFPSFCMIVTNQGPSTAQAAKEEEPFRAKPGLFPLATQVKSSPTASCPESDSVCPAPIMPPGRAHTSPSPTTGLLKGP